MDALPFAETELGGTIAERFRRVAGWLPQHQAIVANDAELTYGALDAASERVMRAIARRNLPPTGPVAVLLPQGAHVLAAILGCLKAGHSFVVLSPDFPTPRLRAIWTDAASPLLLTDGAHWQQAVAVAPGPEQCLDLDQIAAGGDAPAQPGAPGTDELAALFYTSGTTGEPKGVMWSQRLVLHTARQNQALYDLGPQDRLAVLTSFGFGAAMTMSFAALLGGATLLLGEERWLDLDALVAWLRARAPSVLGLPPVGLLSQIVDRLSASTSAIATLLPALRLVLLGGQPLRRQEADRFRACLGEAVDIRYRLAGSETMLMAEFSLSSQLDYAGDNVPVGNPAPDKEIWLLDEERHPVRAGEAGEIAVRSRYLAAGYWRQPQLTAATFLPDAQGGAARICLTGDMGRLTPNGLLLHLGRTDNMVKVRGYRVQLEAVEAALSALDNVREAVVVAQGLPSGEKRLVAYVVPAAAAPPTATALRHALQQRLPDFMAPAVFVFLDRPLPLSATGKVDRLALPPPGSRRPDLGVLFVAPRTALEQQIADLWAELLGLDEVGVDDNFFDLGGDSILAMRMLLQVEKQMGQAAAYAFFRQPTVAYLASGRAEAAEAVAGAMAPTQAEPTQQPHRRRPWRARVGARLRRFMERGPLRNDRAFLPYGIGIRMQRALVAQPAVRRLFARELDALRRWQAELGMPHDEQTRRISLLANTWLWWRQRSLVDPDAFARWVIVSGAGWSLVERASPLCGVVLVVPHVGSSITPLEQVLRLRGRETARVVTDRSLPRTGDRATWEAQQTPARAAQLWQARQVLQRGGVVLIAGDGLGGQRTVDVPFWGRRWPFQVGAAALAVEAGALFVPVWVTFDAASRVHMEVAAPLVAHAAAEEERIAELTRQYGQLYAARWPEFYASARWQYLTYALELPAA